MNFQQIQYSELNKEDAITRRTPSKSLIKSTQTPVGKPSIQFESVVLNYLLLKKDAHSISEIYRLQNSAVDCCVILKNGSSVIIEFKSVLNWDKSNVARSQMLMFKFGKYFERLDLPNPDFGIIIFESFYTDWLRVQGGRIVENGWPQFYWEQKFYDHLFKIRLAQLKNGELWNPFSETV